MRSGGRGRMNYVPPEISVEFDIDTEEYALMATNHGRSAEVGPRIFRAEPWPAILFRHTSENSANKDATTLRAYLDDCASGRRREEAVAGKEWWEK